MPLRYHWYVGVAPPPVGVAVKVKVVVGQPVVPGLTPMLTAGMGVDVGLTVIVKLAGVPGQPLAVGVTVIVATTGVAPAFVAVNDGIPAVPLAPRPIAVLLFVHAKVVLQHSP